MQRNVLDVVLFSPAEVLGKTLPSLVYLLGEEAGCRCSLEAGRTGGGLSQVQHQSVC